MNVLFLSTGNSARSIVAEAFINARGEGRLLAYSAGSRPRGEVHPLALETLRTVGLPTAGLRSKSWDEFAAETAPHMDAVITLCDLAAAEAGPLWPGAPVRAHWSLPDPGTVEGSEQVRLAAFAATFIELERRVNLLLGLPFEFLSPDELEQQLRAIASSG